MVHEIFLALPNSPFEQNTKQKHWKTGGGGDKDSIWGWKRKITNEPKNLVQKILLEGNQEGMQENIKIPIKISLFFSFLSKET